MAAEFVAALLVTAIVGFLAGGLYWRPAGQLKRLRAELQQHQAQLRRLRTRNRKAHQSASELLKERQVRAEKAEAHASMLQGHLSSLKGPWLEADHYEVRDQETVHYSGYQLAAAKLARLAQKAPLYVNGEFRG